MNLFFCLVLTLVEISAPNPEITGKIVDDHTKPVAGISIAAVALPSSHLIGKAISGSDGSFSFAGLADVGYGPEAEAGSACAFSDAIQVDDGFTRFVQLRLVKGLCKTRSSYVSRPREQIDVTMTRAFSAPFQDPPPLPRVS